MESLDKIEVVYFSDPESGIGILPKAQFTFTWSSGVPLTVHLNIACPPNITTSVAEMFIMAGSAGVKKGNK